MAELLTRLEDYEDGEEVAKNVALISFEGKVISGLLHARIRN